MNWRTSLFAIGLVAAMSGPAAARVNGPAWVFTEALEAEVHDAAGLGIVLQVGCDPEEGKPNVTLGVPGPYGSQGSGSYRDGKLFAQRFKGFQRGTLRVFDGASRVTATAEIKAHHSGDEVDTVWIGAEIEPRVLFAIKRAARIEVVSAQWTATFSGSGSAKAIDRGSCRGNTWN